MCNSNYGPIFGDLSYDDLQVRMREDRGHGVSYISYLNLGHGFTRPKNVDSKTYFTGVDPSEVSELEVFRVNL